MIGLKVVLGLALNAMAQLTGSFSNQSTINPLSFFVILLVNNLT